MHPQRKRRLLLVLALVAAAAVAVTLVSLALQRNVAYLYTPAEVLGGSAGAEVAAGQARFRLGGMVEKGSFQRASGSMEARFEVTDGDARLPVSYTGILPDLFREGQSIVATGAVKDGRFVATEVLAKHDESYMPKEVRDAIDKAKQVQADAPTDG